MHEVRGGDFLTEAGIGWREAYQEQMKRAVRPLPQAAE